MQENREVSYHDEEEEVATTAKEKKRKQQGHLPKRSLKKPRSLRTTTTTRTHQVKGGNLSGVTPTIRSNGYENENFHK